MPVAGIGAMKKLKIVLNPTDKKLKCAREIILPDANTCDADDLSRLVSAAMSSDGFTVVDTTKGGAWEKERCVALYCDPPEPPVKSCALCRDYPLVPLSVIAADLDAWAATTTFYAVDPRIAENNKKDAEKKKKQDAALNAAVEGIFVTLTVHTTFTALCGAKRATAFLATAAVSVVLISLALPRLKAWLSNIEHELYVKLTAIFEAKVQPGLRFALDVLKRIAKNRAQLACLSGMIFLEMHVEGGTPRIVRALASSLQLLAALARSVLSYRVEPALRSAIRSLYYDLPREDPHADAFERALPRVCERITTYKREHWEQNLSICRDLFEANETDLLNDVMRVLFVFGVFVAGVVAPLQWMTRGAPMPMWGNLMMLGGAIGAYMLLKQIRTLSDFNFFSPSQMSGGPL